MRVGPDVLVGPRSGPRSDSAGTEAGAMGGTASTRRVTFEADENENITVVKGIRVSAVGGRRAVLELGSQRGDVSGTAAPAFSALGLPCCPARNLGLWEEARSFKTRNLHSEKVLGCVLGAMHCAGLVVPGHHSRPCSLVAGLY